MSSKDKLINKVLENKSVKRYKELEAFIENNEEFLSLINDLKDIQKQLINAKEFNKQNAVVAFTNMYNETLSKIENYPLINEYLALQSDINYMVQEIIQIIEDGLDTWVL